MFHSRNMENRLVYSESHDLSFSYLLLKDKSITIHQKNLHILAIEIYKAKPGISPEIISHLFLFIEKPYNLRQVDDNAKNAIIFFVQNSNENISSLTPKLWTIQGETSANIIKDKIKSWSTDKYPCRLCKGTSVMRVSIKVVPSSVFAILTI